MLAACAAGSLALAPGRAHRLRQRAERFDRMLEALSLDAEAIACVEDRRMRQVLEGVAAVDAIPPVRQAFQILHDDLAPVRLAADVLFPALEKTTQAARETQSGLEIPELELHAARQLFDAIDADGSGGLSRDELHKSGLVCVLDPDLDPDMCQGGVEQEVKRFLTKADLDEDGQISFVEFAIAASSDPRFTDVLTALRPPSVASRAAVNATAEQSGHDDAGRRRKQKTPDERFDEMVATFVEWEEALLDDRGAAGERGGDSGDSGSERSRLERVLDGCFVGAREPAVVGALRIVYADFTALRVVGDLIFKVVREVVERKRS